ncbi:hypothetical protein KFK14_11440 [Sphingobium phenoxybenzoativorans]|uniref:Uncharacterized protein n=1 Tax=Sphingobium phenoxybenzoativorans TaxID=1592790 RepID=A0A975KCW9_9SPHN|nr:hypothetical protein [Sphingobium phenoxybenzoativorans]QUT07942.1 hypothetical protein KFK14_11440 [Sphingobium phenoxybenzoativorans]
MISLFRRKPSALDLLGADRARRYAEVGGYRTHRDNQLCPARKQHIHEVIYGGKVRPRKTNKGYPI